MAILQRVVQEALGDEAGRVADVGHEDGSHLVGNGTHTLVVPIAAIGRGTGNDEFRLALKCNLLHLVVVDTTGFLGDMVSNGLVEHTRSVDRAAV